MSFGRDTESVIAQNKMPSIVFLSSGEMNDRRLLPRSILDGIADEILKQLNEMSGVSADRREVVACHHRL
jgi:hypothetical protein